MSRKCKIESVGTSDEGNWGGKPVPAVCTLIAFTYWMMLGDGLVVVKKISKNLKHQENFRNRVFRLKIMFNRGL